MSFAPDRGLKLCGTDPRDDDRSGGSNLRNENDSGFPKTCPSDLKMLHDMGPRAVSALRAAHHERDLSFRD
jgi:hypothetical protein